MEIERSHKKQHYQGTEETPRFQKRRTHRASKHFWHKAWGTRTAKKVGRTNKAKKNTRHEEEVWIVNCFWRVGHTGQMLRQVEHEGAFST